VKTSSPSPTLSTDCEPKPGNGSSALLGFDSAGIDTTASGSAPSAGRGKKKPRQELNNEAPRISESAPGWPSFHSADTTADTQPNCCSGPFDVEKRNFERNPPLRKEIWGGEDAHRLKGPNECGPACRVSQGSAGEVDFRFKFMNRTCRPALVSSLIDVLDHQAANVILEHPSWPAWGDPSGRTRSTPNADLAVRVGRSFMLLACCG
jgi:hypothetical protein